MSACDDWAADSNPVVLILPASGGGCHDQGPQTWAAGTYEMIYAGGCSWTYSVACCIWLLNRRPTDWTLSYSDDNSFLILATCPDAGSGFPPEVWGWNPYANNNVGAWEGAYD